MLDIELISARLHDDSTGRIKYSMAFRSLDSQPLAISIERLFFHVSWHDIKSGQQEAVFGRCGQVDSTTASKLIDGRMLVLHPDELVVVSITTKNLCRVPPLEKSSEDVAADVNWARRMTNSYEVRGGYLGWVARKGTPPPSGDWMSTGEKVWRNAWSAKNRTDLSQPTFVGEAWLGNSPPQRIGIVEKWEMTVV